jgi:hypothetical protein
MKENDGVRIQSQMIILLRDPRSAPTSQRRQWKAKQLTSEEKWDSQVSIQVQPDFTIAVARKGIVVPSLRHDGFIAQHVIVSVDLEKSIHVESSFLPPG